MTRRRNILAAMVMLFLGLGAAFVVYWLQGFQWVAVPVPQQTRGIAPSSPDEPAPAEYRVGASNDQAGAVEVRVIDARGQVISDATVELLGSSRIEPQQSDREGFARWQSIPAGRWRLRVLSRGYTTFKSGSVDVSAGQIARYEAVLEGLKNLVGRVVDHRGEGVGRAVVRAWPEGSPGVVNSARSQSSGVFVLRNLEAGIYLLQARHSRYENSDLTRAELGGPDQIVLQLNAGGEIAGAVEDPQGQEVASFLVRVRSMKRRQGRGRTLRATEGVFSIVDMAPGFYEIRVEAPGLGPLVEPDVQVIGGRVTHLDLAMNWGASVYGRVTDAQSGAPVPGATIRVGDAAPWNNTAAGARVDTDEEGEFLLAGLEPGRRALRVHAKGYDVRLVTLPDLREGREERLDVAIEPTEQGNPTKVRFHGIGAVLRRDPDGAVKVRKVLDGGPAAQSGLRSEDAITEVDGVPVSEMNLGAVIDLIRGESGTTVLLEIVRGPDEQIMQLSLERSSVTYERRKH